MAKSNLNDLANKLEDPEKIMDQALEEMQVSGFWNRVPSIRSVSIRIVSNFVDFSFSSPFIRMIW